MVESNSTDLSQKLSDIEAELRKFNETLDIANQEYSDIKKQMTQLEIDRKVLEIKKTDLSRYVSMQKHNIENKKREHDKVSRDYWACKREGR